MILPLQFQVSLYTILCGFLYGIIIHGLTYLYDSKGWLICFLISLPLHLLYTIIAFVGLYQLNGASFHYYFILFFVIGILLCHYLYLPTLILLFAYLGQMLKWIFKPYRKLIRKYRKWSKARKNKREERKKLAKKTNEAKLVE